MNEPIFKLVQYQWEAGYPFLRKRIEEEMAVDFEKYRLCSDPIIHRYEDPTKHNEIILHIVLPLRLKPFYERFS